MALPKRTLTLVLHDGGGDPYQLAKVEAKLDRPDYLDDGSVLPSRVTAETNAAGVAQLVLVPNELGNQNSRYRVRVYVPNGGSEPVLDETILMPDANVTWRQLMTAQPVTVSTEAGAAVSAYLAALSASEAAAIANYPGHMIGAIEFALDLVGQVARALPSLSGEIDEFASSIEGQKEDVYLALAGLAQALDLAAQAARQVNGGRVSLRGGSLADPALRIGTAKIYSTADDTLSVGIGDSEVVRITGAGMTVYGTVTEA